MKQIYELLRLFFLLTLFLNAQQLTGKVTDEKDNPLSGVSIAINEKATGTQPLCKFCVGWQLGRSNR